VKKILLSILMVIGASVTINAQCIPVPCTYSTSSIPFSLSPVGTNSVATCDDCFSPAVNIGFPFGFMCSSYSSVKISSNGFISFDPSIVNSGCCAGGTIPLNDGVNGIVALFWTDLYNTVSNSITYNSIGIAPNRVFVVTYSDVPICCGVSFPHTGQIKLFETSGIIEMHMLSVPNSGNTLTQGIEDVAGAAGYTTAVMAASGYTASNVAYRYTPVTTNTAVMIPSFPSAITGPTTVCSGQLATFSVSSAPGATSYSWALPAGFAGTSTTNIVSPTITASGTPSLTITYSCGSISSPGNAVVVFNGNPTVAISGGTTTICAGNPVNLAASGAVSYTWSNGAITNTIAPTPSVNTTFSVIGDNGCGTSTAAVNVTVNTSPTVSISGNTLICGTGTNVLTASGANTYSWSTGAVTSSISVSPSVTTNYTVIGTSTLAGNCTNTYTTAVIVSANPTVAITGGTVVACGGLPVNLTANGANTYSWNNGAITSTIAPTPTANTSYTVIGTNTAGCTGNAVKSVTVIPAPTVSVTGAATICLGTGQTVTLTASGANTYSWSTGPITSTIAVSPTVTTSYIAYGTSSVTGCTGNSSVSVVVSPCTGITQSGSQALDLRVYPNPSNGEFTVELKNGLNKTIEVLDLTGRVIFVSTSLKDKVNVNINNLSNGIYYVKVQSNNAVEMIKIVKQ
jgi:hypothetical protein